MIHLLNHRWFVPASILLALLVRAIAQYAVAAGPISDAGWYLTRATELAQGLGFQEDGHPTAFWPVGWPAIIALFMPITGSAELAAAILNLAATVVIMLCMRWFGRQLLDDERAGRLAMLGFAVYPASIGFAANALTETIYPALLMLAMALIVHGRHRNGLLILAGLVLGVATLVKPQTYAFLFGFVVMIWIAWRDVSLLRSLKIGAIVYVCLFAIVLPWSFRNYQVFDQFVLVSTNSGSVLYYAANPETTGKYIDLKSTYPDLGLNWDERVLRQVEHDKAFRDSAVAWIKENPGEYISWMPIKVVMMWASDAAGFWNIERQHPEYGFAWPIVKVINQGFYLIVLLLSLPHLFTVVSRLFKPSQSTDRRALVLWAMPAFVTFLTLFVAAISRYHFPAMPFILLCAAWTISRRVLPKEPA